MPRFELYRDVRNSWRWTYYAANGEEIAVSSEGYEHRADAEAGIRLVRHSGQAATVERAAPVKREPVKRARPRRKARR